jgi:DNA-binding MarR family transcriptional regulator
VAVIGDMFDGYLETILIIGRIHRNYYSVIREELGRIGSTDINSVEAFILFNIGNAKCAVNEVRNRTNYLGSNLTHIIRKLIENGYLLDERSQHDHRVVNVWHSDKGRTLCNWLTEMHDRYIGTSSEPGNHSDLERTLWTLRQIEQLCIDRQLERYF